MVLAWTGIIFRLFFEHFLNICLGEWGNRPESIFSLFVDYALEPTPKPFFSYLGPVVAQGGTSSLSSEF